MFLILLIITFLGIHSANYNLSQELTTISPLSCDAIKDTSMRLNRENYEIQKGIYLLPLNQEFQNHQNINGLKSNNLKNHETTATSLKSIFELSKEGKEWFDKSLRKRNVDDTNNRKKIISKRKQKKAKVLGRLLRNNIWIKNYEDIQDDYMEDEDDYSINMSRKKMKWEDFRNEDGASVMELIALNARHKTNMHQARNNN
ncbi:uncharacterized protein LOC117607127 [Osmia lignaria lignaria]|uniref:uncharacterized protein LOC117607127 n=1 Tax=Osmia lignaria lignaria TaxID=1437193 RepID=UPI00402BE2DB